MNRLRRLLRYRLIVPVLRGKHAPEHTARGVLFGLMIAMTPTVGIQMPIIFIMWLCMRTIRPSWEFNLIVALAYTWVTNVFTAPPLYYGFLITGRVMMGRWDSLTGYDEFQTRLSTLMQEEAGALETLWIYMVGIFDLWGVPMFLGCVPWAILFSWLGYRWSLRLVQRFRMRRLERLASQR